MPLNRRLKVPVGEGIADDRNGVNLFSNHVVDMKCHVWCVTHTDIEIKDDRAEKHGTR
jgi:hypothetical protein